MSEPSDLLRQVHAKRIEALLAAATAGTLDAAGAAVVEAVLTAPDDGARLAELERAVALYRTQAGATAPGIVTVSTDDVFAALPPTRWVCEGLKLCPGRPAILAGYGFSGKTMAAQSLALSITTARLIWGGFLPSCQGDVLHLDYEQGKHATFKRYQRLAKGLGASRLEIGDRLHVAVHPEVYLTDANAEDVFVRACEGMTLCIIDSLRGATPGVDENDSKVRVYLERLSRVSEKTGTAFLLIHHAGKGSSGDPEADLRQILRGSSAIFDGGGSIFAMVAEKGENASEKPKRVSQIKVAAEADGRAAEPFYLSIEDVEVDGNARGGVKLVYRTVQQVAHKEETNKAARIEDLAARVLEYIRRENAYERGVKGKDAVKTYVEGRDSELSKAVEHLLTHGLVEDRPEKENGRWKPRYWSTTAGDEWIRNRGQKHPAKGA